MPIHPARLDDVVGVQDGWAQASTMSCGASENSIRICIHLSSMPEPELQKIEVFQKGEAQSRVAIRAPNMCRHGTQLSFTWSSAVRGLVGLILMQRCSEEQVWLTGERGSLAAALDSALSKQPGWICELFGIDVKGNSKARRLILRENPERKRSGPVSLSFHHRLLSSGNIAIFVDGNPCDDSNEVLSLRDCFFAAWEGQERGSRRCLSSGRGGAASRLEGTSTQASEELGDLAGESASPANQSDFPARREILADSWWMHTLRTLLQGEASTMLRHHSIFCRETLKRELASIYSSSTYLSVAKPGVRLTSDMDLALSVSARLGVYDEGLLHKRLASRGKPLTVALAATLAPSLALFSFLRLGKGYPIDIDYRFAHSLELLERLRGHQFVALPDVIVLGLVPALTYLSAPGRASYHAFMCMPKASNRVVTSRSRSPRDIGEFVLPSDLPTSASFIFDSLVERGKLVKKATRIVHMEPDEIMARSWHSDESFRSILWFPHYELNSVFHGRELVRMDSEQQDLPTLMLVHESLMRDTILVQSLNAAIRDAWLLLGRSAGELDQILRRIVSDSVYVELFSRYTGLYALEADVLKRARKRGNEYET